jgi:hypothetical protein
MNKKFIINELSRSPSIYPYSGITCDLTNIEPSKVYLTVVIEIKRDNFKIKK